MRSGYHAHFDAMQATGPARAELAAIGSRAAAAIAAMQPSFRQAVATIIRVNAALERSGVSAHVAAARLTEAARMPERSRGHRARLLAITRRQQRALKYRDLDV